MKKRSFLVLLTAGLLMLAGCNKGSGTSQDASSASGSQGSQSGQSSQGGSSQGGGDVEVPVEAGKTTFYITVGADSVALPDYGGYYLTGSFCELDAWPTEAGDPNVVELKKLDGSENVYYGQLGKELEVKEYAYQLTMGYNETSGAPKTGVNWSYKSVPCQAADGKFTPVAGEAINLGEHTWDTNLPEVKMVDDVTVSIEFATAAPAYVGVYYVGSYNGWDNTTPADHLMTADADRKVFTFHFDSVLLASQEVQILVEYADVTAFTWGNKLLNGGENYILGILRKHAGQTISLNDLCFEGEALDFDFATKLPDPTAITYVDLTVKVVADAAITGGLAFAGAFNSWADSALETSDNINFTITVAGKFAAETAYGSSDCGIKAVGHWHKKIQPDSFFTTLAGNTTVTITLKEGGAAYFNAAYGDDEWNGLSADLYTVAVTATAE